MGRLGDGPFGPPGSAFGDRPPPRSDGHGGQSAQSVSGVNRMGVEPREGSVNILDRVLQ